MKKSYISTFNFYSSNFIVLSDRWHFSTASVFCVQMIFAHPFPGKHCRPPPCSDAMEGGGSEEGGKQQWIQTTWDDAVGCICITAWAYESQLVMASYSPLLVCLCEEGAVHNRELQRKDLSQWGLSLWFSSTDPTDDRRSWFTGFLSNEAWGALLTTLHTRTYSWKHMSCGLPLKPLPIYFWFVSFSFTSVLILSFSTSPLFSALLHALCSLHPLFS